MKTKTKIKRILTKKRRDIIIISFAIIAAFIIGHCGVTLAREIEPSIQTIIKHQEKEVLEDNPYKFCDLDDVICPGEKTPKIDIEEYVKNIKVEIPNYEWSIAVKTNNPCNLVYAGQPNATSYKGFAKFKKPEKGFRACLKQIELDQTRNKTLEQFINIYAPKQENNTEFYIDTLSKNLNVTRTEKINNIDLITLAKEVARFESQSIILAKNLLN